MGFSPPSLAYIIYPVYTILWFILILTYPKVNSYCYFTDHNTSASGRIIGGVLREHHEDVIAYIKGTGVISVTNDLFSSKIITEYIYNCVTQNSHTQHASIIVALECRLYVTLDHNPEDKLETLLNVFMKVESVGPDVASIIRQVSRMYS